MPPCRAWSSSVSGPANADASTVAGFGAEWQRFDQAGLSAAEAPALFEKYFDVFPGTTCLRRRGIRPGLRQRALGALRRHRGGTLHCVDASADALAVARRNLRGRPNCHFHHASVDDCRFADDSMDFGYSLGVLHHVPDTAAGIRACVRSSNRARRPALLYYRFDNRPAWYRAFWRLRKGPSRRVPAAQAARACRRQIVAGGVYWPLARRAVWWSTGARTCRPSRSPSIASASYYTMRTDALDRFGTRLEQRFTRAEIVRDDEGRGPRCTRFSDQEPFWCAIGHRRA